MSTCDVQHVLNLVHKKFACMGLAYTHSAACKEDRRPCRLTEDSLNMPSGRGLLDAPLLGASLSNGHAFPSPLAVIAPTHITGGRTRDLCLGIGRASGRHSGFAD